MEECDVDSYRQGYQNCLIVPTFRSSRAFLPCEELVQVGNLILAFSFTLLLGANRPVLKSETPPLIRNT